MTSARIKDLVKNLAVMLFVFILLDVTIGLVLLDDNKFRGKPTPPYELTFTDSQKKQLEPDYPAPTYIRFDTDLGWTIRSNGTSADGMLRANAAGFRAQREYDLSPRPGTLRVSTFGNSFTHSDEVVNEESWAHLLETMGDNREVLNFGVGGFGTDQAFLRYRRDGAQYQPNVVVIGFLLENILRNVSVYRPAYYHGTGSISVKPRFVVNNAETLTLLPNPIKSREELVEAIRSRSLLPILKETDFWVQRAPLAYDDLAIFRSSLGRIAYSVLENSGRRYGELYFRDSSSEPFRVTRAILKTFVDEAQANGAEMVIVVIFPPKNILARILDGAEYYWDSLTSFLDENGIPYIDVTAPLVEAAQRDGLDSLFVFYHFSKAGNEIVAEELNRMIFDKP